MVMARGKKNYSSTHNRVNKEKSINCMYDQWIEKNPFDYIRVGVFNPSVTCLDLDIAVQKELIKEDTKLIFFENFKYLQNKKDRSELMFKKEVMKHIPMVKEENIFFHFGELETLQLGGALMSFKDKNIPLVNFMFIDLCGEINANHAKWMYDNRFFIEDGSYQFYTVNVQAKLRYDCQKKIEMSKEFAPQIDFFDFRMKERKEQEKTFLKLQEVMNHWEFVCSHIINVNMEKKKWGEEGYHSLSNIKPIVYNDGKQWMGIFNGICGTNIQKNLFEEISNENKDYLWKFYNGFLKNSFAEKTENLEVDKVLWEKVRTHGIRFTDSLIALYRDMPIPEFNGDIQPIINSYKKVDSYTTEDKNKKKMSDFLRYVQYYLQKTDKNFFPNLYSMNKKYQSLVYNRTRMIFNNYFLNKPFLDRETGKEGMFKLVPSVKPTKNRGNYIFEYLEKN